MRTFLILLALLAGIAAILFATGFFDAVGSSDTTTSTDDSATDSTSSEGTDLVGKGPKVTMEPPTPRALLFPHRGLFLARRPLPWAKFLELHLQSLDKLSYQTWFTDSVEALHDEKGPGAGMGRGLPALTEPPTAEYLEEHNIDLLIVDDIDPHELSDNFWEAVRTRVNERKMGLFIHPGIPFPSSKRGGENKTTPTVHAFLEHAIVKTLLPVTEAQEIKGSPVPGFAVSGKARKFKLTTKGETHPAAQLYRDAARTKIMWNLVSEGDHGWRVKFCYPVTKLAEGATTLVELESDDLEKPAALVASNADTRRVLWLGTESMGWDTFYESGSTRRAHALMSRWMGWLAGEE